MFIIRRNTGIEASLEFRNYLRIGPNQVGRSVIEARVPFVCPHTDGNRLPGRCRTQYGLNVSVSANVDGFASECPLNQPAQLCLGFGD